MWCVHKIRIGADFVNNVKRWIFLFLLIYDRIAQTCCLSDLLSLHCSWNLGSLSRFTIHSIVRIYSSSVKHESRVGFGYWKNISGRVGYRVFVSNTKSIGYYRVSKSWSSIHRVSPLFSILSNIFILFDLYGFTINNQTCFVFFFPGPLPLVKHAYHWTGCTVHVQLSIAHCPPGRDVTEVEWVKGWVSLPSSLGSNLPVYGRWYLPIAHSRLPPLPLSIRNCMCA